MTDPARLLAAYDDQLRTDAETPGAASVTRLGPLRLVTFSGGRGFVTYRDLDGADAGAVRQLVSSALDHFRGDTGIDRVEWKTRGHDHAPGLHEALLEHGFAPDEPESIMIGDARGLAVDVPLPEGVTVRRVTGEADVRAISAMADEVFGDPVSDVMADSLLRRLARGDGMELWVAEADGRIVSAGRLEPVQGLRLRRALGRGDPRGVAGPRHLPGGDRRAGPVGAAMGKTLLHSDSTEFSRPILERSGLVKVSTTTPYEWKR